MMSMFSSASNRICNSPAVATIAFCSIALRTLPAHDRRRAAAFEPQGEGRVTAVIDARSFRLDDGREVRLAGIEPVTTRNRAKRPRAALSAILDRAATSRCTATTTRRTATAVSPPLCFSRTPTRRCRASC